MLLSQSLGLIGQTCHSVTECNGSKIQSHVPHSAFEDNPVTVLVTLSITAVALLGTRCLLQYVAFVHIQPTQQHTPFAYKYSEK